jgi:hypothetical protein
MERRRTRIGFRLQASGKSILLSVDESVKAN